MTQSADPGIDAPGWKEKEADRVPPSQVNKIHANSDVDSASFAQHHTLGIRGNQATSGAHTHDGVTSKQIKEGASSASVTGSRDGNVALGSLLVMLHNLGIIEDNTSA